MDYGIPSSGPQRITLRTSPCNCGCKGTDPWHKKEIVRIVHNIVPVSAPDLSQMFVTIAEGQFRHPSGERRALCRQACIDGVLRGAPFWIWENAK